MSNAPHSDKGNPSQVGREAQSQSTAFGRSDTNSTASKKEIHEHIKGRGLISSVALGLSDGLVTNIAFLAGFGGAVSDIGVIRFAGLAVTLAGAISMFFGGLLAGRSERDLFEADLVREQNEIENEPEEEKDELRSLYLEKGLTTQEADIVVRRITSDKRKWLEDLLTQEVHIHKTELQNPLTVALAIGLAFVAGASVPLIPYLLLTVKSEALVISIIVSLIFLFGAGYWKGHLVGRRKWKGGLEMLAIGAVASSLLFVIGSELHVFV
jgi:VIT1/CCC1 family predicted Fe2+/Mn2+ transporter